MSTEAFGFQKTVDFLRDFSSVNFCRKIVQSVGNVSKPISQHSCNFCSVNKEKG
jgi:hypothetical protein